MANLRLFLLLTVCLSAFAGGKAHAQFFLEGVEEARAADNAKTIMWYDGANAMTMKKVGVVNTDMKEDIPAFSHINSNYKMIKEFEYEGGRAFLLFRTGKAEGGQIGLVELYLTADEPNTLSLLGFAEVTAFVRHNTDGPGFYSLRAETYTDKDSRTGKKAHYRCGQYRIDDNTAGFMISFLNNKKFYKNATKIEQETTASPRIDEPYERPAN